VHPLARVRLFAALAAVGLQAPSSNSERAAVMCRFVVDTLPAVAAVVQAATSALPQLGYSTQQAWSNAGQACAALAELLGAAVHQSAPLTQRGFDSAAAALLATLQLRALLSSLQSDWRTWQQQQLSASAAADRTSSQHTRCCSKSGRALLSLAGQPAQSPQLTAGTAQHKHGTAWQRGHSSREASRAGHPGSCRQCSRSHRS